MSRDGCGCMCHQWPDVKHVVQCCNAPPCDGPNDPPATVAFWRDSARAMQEARDDLIARHERVLRLCRDAKAKGELAGQGGLLHPDKVIACLGLGWLAERGDMGR